MFSTLLETFRVRSAWRAMLQGAGNKRSSSVRRLKALVVIETSRGNVVYAGRLKSPFLSRLDELLPKLSGFETDEQGFLSQLAADLVFGTDPTDFQHTARYARVHEFLADTSASGVRTEFAAHLMADRLATLQIVLAASSTAAATHLIVQAWMRNQTAPAELAKLLNYAAAANETMRKVITETIVAQTIERAFPVTDLGLSSSLVLLCAAMGTAAQPISKTLNAFKDRCPDVLQADVLFALNAIDGRFSSDRARTLMRLARDITLADLNWTRSGFIGMRSEWEFMWSRFIRLPDEEMQKRLPDLKNIDIYALASGAGDAIAARFQNQCEREVAIWRRRRVAWDLLAMFVQGPSAIEFAANEGLMNASDGVVFAAVIALGTAYGTPLPGKLKLRAKLEAIKSSGEGQRLIVNVVERMLDGNGAVLNIFGADSSSGGGILYLESQLFR